MDMKIIKSEKRLCTCCMEEHEVKTVLVEEQMTFKNVKVVYKATYFYCDEAEEFYMDEEQIQENDIHLKDAYREKEGLLTSGRFGAFGKNRELARVIYAHCLDGAAKQLPDMKVIRFRIKRAILF